MNAWNAFFLQKCIGSFPEIKDLPLHAVSNSCMVLVSTSAGAKIECALIYSEKVKAVGIGLDSIN